MVEKSLNRRNLQIRLRQQGHKCLCCNVHLPGWFEADLFSINRQHQFVEHEFKASVSDYKADFRKHDRKQSKHWRLASHDIRGPAYFWFVCDFDPPSLPEYAGWKTTHGTIKRKAPKLHTFRVGIHMMIHVANSLSYRIR